MRHGVDVAASLARRHSEALRAATGELVPSALTVIRDHALGVLSSRRGWTLAEALTMWEQYVEKARQESAALGERALEIRYEDLLTQPEVHAWARALYDAEVAHADSELGRLLERRTDVAPQLHVATAVIPSRAMARPMSSMLCHSRGVYSARARLPLPLSVVTRADLLNR